MVASDTLVGIVGAVILTVALIGVFVFEASSGSDAQEVPARGYAASSSGSLEYTAPTTGPPDCQPPVIECTAEETTVTMSVQNLPELRGGDLHYGAFLRKPSQNLFMDTLTKSGANYQLEWSDDADHQDAEAVVVTLETTATPGGLGIVLFNASVASGGSISFSGNVTLAQVASQALVVSEGGDAATVTGALTELRDLDGYEYRIWLHDDGASGSVWRLVQNISMPDEAPGGTFTASVDGSVSGPTDGGYDNIWVSLERADSAQTVMSGFPVYQRAV
jgi:hypothetical protein